MDAKAYFEAYPSATRAWKVGDQLFHDGFVGSAQEYSQRCGKPVEEVLRSGAAKFQSKEAAKAAQTEGEGAAAARVLDTQTHGKTPEELEAMAKAEAEAAAEVAAAEVARLAAEAEAKAAAEAPKGKGGKAK